MQRYKAILGIILALIACSILFYFPFLEVKSRTIDSYNAQQRILAKQAVKGIQLFFGHHQKMLSSLTRYEQIIDFDQDGKRLLEEFQSLHEDEISAITRIDKFGRILYTVPYNEEAIGKDVSFQAHNRHIIEHHEPVVSEVFKAVQGFLTVALAIPVFKDDAYQGSLTILIPFQLIAQRYLDDIRQGDSGYAWVISRNGVELFCPVPNHTGFSIYETSSRFPSVIAMAEKMMVGEEGETIYFYDRVLENKVRVIKKHAVYMPVELPNTYWSIVVATPEEQVLAAMNDFRNSWFFLLVATLAVAVYYTVYLLKTQARFREEEAGRLAAEALQQSEEKYRLLVENTNDLIFIAQDEDLKYVNPATEKILGYTGEELKGIPFIDHIHPQDRYIVLDRHRRRLAGEEVPNLYSFRVVNKDGEDIYLQINSRLITLEGRPAIMNLARDITGLKRAAIEKEALEGKLRQALKMEAIGTLAGGIAHDFNNILTAILGYTELAQDKLPAGSEVYDDLEDVYNAGIRARDLVKHILLFSRQGDESRGSIEIELILREALKLLRAALPTTIQIQEAIGKSCGVINGDPTQIHQVIMNLCTNSWHAMEESGGIIEVKLDCVDVDETESGMPDPGRYVHLSVIDNGHGMDEKTLERIYDPYFTTKEVGKGSGMGLATVHGIVSSHGGFMKVDSTPGQGACFQLYFPLIDEVVEREEQVVELLPVGTERILFVDDEAAIAIFGEKALEHLGYTVTSVSDSRRALELFIKDPLTFDLVITDQTMPELPGSELAALLLKVRPDIPIILCTGFSTIIDEEQAKKIGIREFVMKPIVIKDLARIVRKCLDELQAGSGNV